MATQAKCPDGQPQPTLIRLLSECREPGTAASDAFNSLYSKFRTLVLRRAERAAKQGVETDKDDISQRMWIEIFRNTQSSGASDARAFLSEVNLICMRVSGSFARDERKFSRKTLAEQLPKDCSAESLPLLDLEKVAKNAMLYIEGLGGDIPTHAKLIFEGKTNKEVHKLLGVSLRTAETRRNLVISELEDFIRSEAF